MRLPDDCWTRALEFANATQLARAAPAAPALRSAVSRAVKLALGTRPGSTTYDLRLHELRSVGCERVARSGESLLFVTRSGELVEFEDADAAAPAPHTWVVGGTRFVSVSTGHNFIVALTETGQLWSFGAGSDGQLGHGDRLNKDEPTCIDALADRCVVNVSCGCDHAWAVTHSGEVYGWGHVAGVLHDFNSDNVSRRAFTALPDRVETNGVSMVSACGGYDAVILVSNDGRIFGSGRNSYGELGVGDTTPRYASQSGGLVQLGGDALNGEFVVKASIVKQSLSSGIHTLVLTSSGKLFGFGSNHYGQLAADDYGNVTSPRLIDGFTNVTDICAMDAGSFVITGGKKLYTFGAQRPSLPADDDDTVLEDFPAPTPFFLDYMSLDSGRLLSICANGRSDMAPELDEIHVVLLGDADDGAGEKLFSWHYGESTCTHLHAEDGFRRSSYHGRG